MSGPCKRCRDKWTGKNTCHCTACHRNFKGFRAFDKHRSGMVCTDPEKLGMEMNEKGIWRFPMPPGRVYGNAKI